MFNNEKYPNQIIDNNIVIYKDNRAYPELQQFLEQVEAAENSQFHQPYFINKKRVFLYKTIFFIFGSLFLILAAVIYFKNPNWIGNFFLKDGILIKHLVEGVSLMLSSIAYYISYNLRTELEVAKHMAYRGRMLLWTKYRRMRAKFNLIDCLPFSKHYQKKDLLRQTYLDALDAIHHQKDEYLSLLIRIDHTQSLSKDVKEKLYNQTLLKFKDAIEDTLATLEVEKK